MARIPTVRSQGAKAYQNVNMSDGQTRFMSVPEVDISAGSRQQGEIWSNALDSIASAATKWQEGEDKRQLVKLEGEVQLLQSYLLEDPDLGGLATLQGDEALNKINGGWDRALTDNSDPNALNKQTKYAIALDEYKKLGYTYDNKLSLAENYKANIDRLLSGLTGKDGSLSGLSTDAANTYIQKTTQQFSDNVKKYQDVAYKAKNEKLFAGKMTDYANQATTAWNDDKKLDNILSNIATLVKDKDIGIAAQKGITDAPTIEQLVQTNQALAVEAAIKQAQATGNDVVAKELLTKYSANGVLKGEKLTTLTSLLKDSSRDNEANDFVMDLANKTETTTSSGAPGEESTTTTTTPYKKMNPGGTVEIFDIVKIEAEILKKYAKDPEGMKAALTSLDRLDKANKRALLEDEREAILQVSKLLLENKPIPAELASRLPVNYNLGARQSSAITQNENIDNNQEHRNAGGVATTQTAPNGDAYDETILEILNSGPDGVAYALEKFTGPDGDKFLRGVLSSTDYEKVTEELQKAKNKVEIAKLKAQGKQIDDLPKLIKNNFNISSASTIQELSNNEFIKSELDQFIVNYFDRKGTGPTKAEVTRFLAPLIVEVVTKEANLVRFGMPQPEEIGYLGSNYNDASAAKQMDLRPLKTDGSRNKGTLAIIFGTTKDTITTIIKDLQAAGSTVSMGNINAAIQQGNYQATTKGKDYVSPIMLLDKQGFEFFQRGSGVVGGFPTIFKTLGFPPLVTQGSPKGTKTAFAIYGYLASEGKIPPITEEILSQMPQKGKTAGGPAYKVWATAVQNELANIQASDLNTIADRVSKGNSLYANMDLGNLKSGVFNQTFADMIGDM